MFDSLHHERALLQIESTKSSQIGITFQAIGYEHPKPIYKIILPAPTFNSQTITGVIQRNSFNCEVDEDKKKTPPRENLHSFPCEYSQNRFGIIMTLVVYTLYAKPKRRNSNSGSVLYSIFFEYRVVMKENLFGWQNWHAFSSWEAWRRRKDRGNLQKNRQSWEIISQFKFGNHRTFSSDLTADPI